MTTQEQLERVNQAKQAINFADEPKKNEALAAMADHLLLATDAILIANQKDMTAARGQISNVMLDRLFLDQERIAQMAQGLRDLIALEDPIGEILEERILDNGLILTKRRVPMGVIGIIYESRPNVTSDAAGLALKSGSAVVLRSGKDAYQSALAIVEALKAGLETVGIDPEVIQLIADTSRDSSYAMMKAKGYLDLLIPRGGAGLIQAVVEQAIVPVIETGTGIVHVYVDKSANLDQARDIVVNAKTSRPSVCNAMEVLLVHREVAQTFLPMLQEALVTKRQEAGEVPVELRLDNASQDIIPGTKAQPEDFDTEFLDYILAVKIVDDVDEAIAHIALHSTHHSESIITQDPSAMQRFTDRVDSTAVYVNASTRFTDGAEFGLGCEMGISTQKLHARGPMGLREMTTYKYVIKGDGQIR